MKEAGFAVDLAGDGRDGLHFALHEKYDAAIVDLMLPHVDGLKLIESMRAVASGEIWLDKRYANLGAEPQESESDVGPRFNERQRKVLRFVLEGLSNKEISGHLQISESYVKAILQSLFQQTGVRTRGQLVRVALEQYADQL